MICSSTPVSADRTRVSGLALVLFILAALATLLPVGQAWASKALVYNATGEDLNIVVNGRSNLIPWSSPVQIFSEAGQESLHLEMANTNGELLKRELEPDSAYIILYQVSEKSFAVWRTEVLETNLDKILDEHPANARAAVFNSTGRPMIFQYGPWKQGVGDELCVFTPNAGSAKNLKFKIIHPDLGFFGPVPQMSLHVVTFEESKGYLFQSFQTWVAGLEARLNGSQTGPTPEAAAPAEAEEEKPPVLQEDLKDG
jgi:hypothetical protein